MSFTKEKTSEALVARLREASKAYYETSKPLMTDAEYDDLLDNLKRISPDHAFLKEVGYKPTAGLIKLPVPMASLDKRKPESLRSEDLNKGPYVITDKLDGISALYVCGFQQKPALYLRGDGLEGQNVSHCMRGILGLPSCSGPTVIVRGELIVPKGVIQGTLARNWVNGILHQKEPCLEDLAKIHFVAYQVCEPATLTRSQQMTWLLTKGFEVAWYHIYPKLDVDLLKGLFQTRRSSSLYECDGLVVGQDCVPKIPSNASNPKDAYAFKMPLDDQRATTTVKEVDWASSRTGNWIPRIRFEPVQIGTATIEYCTGFHGQHIYENSIGPGAVIVIRRSGDVIPTLEKVLEPCPNGWQAPPEGRWKWDENKVHCIDSSEEATPEKLALEMEHQLVALGVEGISKVTAKKVVLGGIKDLLAVYSAKQQTLQDLIGKVNGQKLWEGLQKGVKEAKQEQWIRAFLGWPKGFGQTRIEATLALEPNVSKWTSLVVPPKGQSAAAFEEVKKVVPEYLKWRNQFPESSVETPVVKPKPQPQAVKGQYVMTGFRDAELQTKLAEKGWILQDKINKQTTVLLVADTSKETTKTKAARETGIRILARSEASSLF